MDEPIKDILDVLNSDHVKTYPLETMDEALQHEAELTPYLIKTLEDVLTNYHDFLVRERFFGHIFAMNLLAHFRNPGVHDTIVKLMALPPDIVSDFFGDMVTEDFPRILYQTCGGRYDQIRELILNEGAYEFVRGSAMEALVHGVLLDNRSRQETLDFLCSLLESSDLKDLDHFWNAAASCIHNLYPEESMDIIRSAYEKGLIWPGYIGIESFERALLEDKADFLSRQREHIESRIQKDFHEYMSWWACFNEDKTPFRKGIDPPLSMESPSKRKDNRKKKAKRKAAKASKRKNRRR